MHALLLYSRDSSMAFIESCPISKRKSRNRNLPPFTCNLSDRPSQEALGNDKLATTLQSLLDSSSVLARLKQGGTEAAEAAQTAFLTALGSLGVSAHAPDGADIDDVEVPTSPPFDPVQACVLAGYAFRAYEEPPPGCYREVRETKVSSQNESAQVIVTHYAFPDSDVITRTAIGVFQISLDLHDDPNLHLVVRLNSAIRGDALETRAFSLLRRKPSHDSAYVVDELELLAYRNATEYSEGRPPILRGSVPLADVVARAEVDKAPTDAGPYVVELLPVSVEVVNRNFFSTSRIPPNLRLPFMHIERLASSIISSAQILSATVSVDVTYVPFDMAPPDECTLGDESYVDNDDDDTKESKNEYGEGSALQEALREKLQPGEMPLPPNWKTLAKDVRELAREVDAAQLLEEPKKATVREDISQSLFVESLSTGTEVWLFHAADTKDLIVAFRGTEQMNWQDFVTDAQIFLQRWDPGGDIDLELSESTTVGISELVVAAGLSGNEGVTKGDFVDDQASCVHYGFLRAYHSVRDAVLHAIKSVSGETLSKHRVCFVGHSLGGGLATLCAADFATLYPEAAHGILCVSYGAPKAGNAGFALQYNRLVRNSFRIVNDTDVVVRMPKSIGARACERYRHVGRTVLVNEHGELWVEGDSIEDNDDGSGEHYKLAAMDPFRERYTDVAKLIEYEQQMWQQLVSGQSLRHHMVSFALCASC